ncbi:MAG TPA: DUF1015 domain-containing protein [Polyangia bacterium]|nr:DUF1015 domain-containing protein [Polyangia bacterium]
MALIAPFAGLRYDAARVGDIGQVLAPPYDVIGEVERAALEERHPENVVRIELPRGDTDARYAEAARRLDAWREAGILRPDVGPGLYVYEQQFRLPGAPATGRVYSRRGFFAAVRLEPFERRVVLPHEATLAGPKEDRLKLMRATRTQISPIFGLYRDPRGASRAVVDAAAATSPDVDATMADGGRHRLWRLSNPEPVATLVDLMADKQILIADGHHRYETMLALGPELRALDYAAGEAAVDFGMMFLARAEDPGLLVLPTHRLVRGLADFEAAALRAAASPAFDIADGDEATPEAIEERLGREGTAGLVFAMRVPGRAQTAWFTLKSIVDLSALGPPALRKLDVTVLHGVLLGPLLAIDETAMAEQTYLDYTHDTAEALARVDSGDAQAAFFMNPTKVEDVLAVCEAGLLLPQKSTYFHPKLATGLVMYGLDGPAPR